MEKFKRVFVIVVDSFGAGNGKDAKVTVTRERIPWDISLTAWTLGDS